MKEIWKSVAGYCGIYEVSSYGGMRSLNRVIISNTYKKKNKGVVLKWSLNQGYPSVQLSKNSKAKTYRIHRLVAQAFIPNPDNKACINHLDGNKLNNNVSNLAWCTYSENSKHAIEKGLNFLVHHKGVAHYRAKLTDRTVLEIRKLYSKKVFRDNTVELIAKKYKISKENVYAIALRYNWKHI